MADSAKRGLANIQWNLLIFFEDKNIISIFRYCLLLAIVIPIFSSTIPIKLSNAQIKIFNCIPCHMKINVKHKNDANNFGQYPFDFCVGI